MRTPAILGRILAATGLVLFAGMLYAASASTISGTVYDNQRNALAQVNVELLDEYYALKKYTVTDGIGRYTFEGLSDGDYYVKVLPFKYDFDEQTQPVRISTISLNASREGVMNAVADFALSPRKGTLSEARAQVIFAQEGVTPEAKKAFEEGMKLMKKGKTDDAIVQFESAVKAFPAYFMANHYLGAAYFQKNDYEHAAPPLMKAVEANDKSPLTLYYLGYTFHKLNYNPAAIVALKAASVLTPSSFAIQMTLGASQRMQRDYENAEKSLLQAKKLLQGNNPELYKELAALYGETRRFDKGAESLEQMLKSGTYSEADTARVKEQIKAWKELAAKQAAKKQGT